MKLKIKKMDCNSIIADLKIKNKNITIPNILSIQTDRINGYEDADIKISKKTDFKEIETLYYSFQDFQRPKKFVDLIITKKKENKIIYLPAIAEPNNLSLLIYLGINLFDTINAISSARKKIMFFPDGNKKVDELFENPCTCKTCSKLDKKVKDFTFNEILNHNYNVLFSELKNIKNHIYNKNLRSLIEKRVISSPHLTSILRYLDQNYYYFLEEKTPLISSNQILCTTQDSLSRPEIKRFQERLLKNYSKPKSAKILLLLPCSNKKPYSFSKSHSLFKNVIKSCKNPNIIHEVVITSPMGVVPRDLELIYPAANYDISVIGIWYEEEKYMINDIISNFVKSNHYDKVISHLKQDMNIFIEKVLKIDIKTCLDHPTSDKSLEKLKMEINKISDAYNIINYKDRIKEDMQSFASFFYKKISEKIFRNSYVKGKYPYYKIFNNNTQIGMLVKEKGMISFTLEGANILFDNKINNVKISNDFDLVGSVFAPGIIDSDKDIRIGDEVAVIKNNKLVANGTALMCGEDMKKLNYGEAVKIRHIKKD